ncbi:MAG TPA: hypothetical protein VJI69_09830 [Bacteroidia bacterium]|nr:hypothetical protein [Bacteroidia bacterium]
MKKLFLLTFIVAFSISGVAQNAGAYLDKMSKEFKDISADMWDYTSAVAHGKSARKVESRRKDVLKSNMDAQSKIRSMGAFDGDKTLKDSVLAFLKLSYNVINYDYAKIVDMEEIAEQSYDAMEAYLLAQEKANEKLNASGEMLDAQYSAFAAKNNITLVDKEDKIDKNLKVAGLAFKYYNVVYLIFFKSYKQEAYMIDALNKNDVNGLKQNADALSKAADEGLAKLDTLKAFKGDNTLKVSCKELLTFYKKEATAKIPTIVNFAVKKENFDKIKTAMDAKDPKSRTKEDIDGFNAAVNDFNKASNEYNTVNNELNTNRTNFLNKWNDAVSRFMDKQVPKKK